jgi:hypothetical protein
LKPLVLATTNATGARVLVPDLRASVDVVAAAASVGR